MNGDLLRGTGGKVFADGKEIGDLIDVKFEIEDRFTPEIKKADAKAKAVAKKIERERRYARAYGQSRPNARWLDREIQRMIGPEDLADIVKEVTGKPPPSIDRDPILSFDGQTIWRGKAKLKASDFENGPTKIPIKFEREVEL